MIGQSEWFVSTNSLTHYGKEKKNGRGYEDNEEEENELSIRERSGPIYRQEACLIRR